MNNIIIDIKNLSKTYNNKLKILKKINYSFKRGKTYSIVGPSGSGKSTLLNILSLIDRPSKGNIIINGKKIVFSNKNYNDKLRANKIGIIYQSHNLLPDFNAYENILLSKLAFTTSQTFRSCNK